MEKILGWLREHGFVLMLVGFLTAVGGLLFYMQTRFSGSVVPQIAFGVTVAGFVLYVIGRIFVATQRKKSIRNN